MQYLAIIEIEIFDFHHMLPTDIISIVVCLLGSRVPMPPPSHLRMMRAAVPPPSSSQLLVYGGPRPPIPRPTAAPVPLLSAGQARPPPLNVPPPREFPRRFSFTDVVRLPVLHQYVHGLN